MHVCICAHVYVNAHICACQVQICVYACLSLHTCVSVFRCDLCPSMTFCSRMAEVARDPPTPRRAGIGVLKEEAEASPLCQAGASTLEP